MNPGIDDNADNSIVGKAVAELLQSVDDGTPIDVEVWLKQYPQVEQTLRDFIQSEANLRQLVSNTQPSNLPNLSTPRLPASTPQESPATFTLDSLSENDLFGPYQLGARLGRGGMGIVYQATDTRLNRLVALKLLRSGTEADDRQRRRFAREAEAIAQLEHPHIVPIYEVGEIQGRHYFAMKLLEPLTSPSAKEPSANSERQIASLVCAVASAVHFAHQHGILHRDLKPTNVLVDSDGKPYVTDFGLARRIDVSDESTLEELLVGTPAFISPEQLSGEATMLSDVYGLGGILYWLLTDRAPHAAKTFPELLASFERPEPIHPNVYRATLNRDLEIICLKALQSDPRGRYQTAPEFQVDLEAWLEGKPIQARPVSPPKRLAMWARRKPALAGLSAALAVTMIGSTGALLYNYSALLTSNQLLSTTNAALNESIEKEQAALKVADQNLHEAMSAVETYLTRVSESRLLDTEKLQPLRRELLTNAVEFYQRFLSQRANQPDLVFDTAAAYRNLGILQMKIGEFSQASSNLENGWALLADILNQNDGDPEVTRLAADIIRQQGLLEARNSELPKAITRFEHAIELLSRQSERTPPEQQTYLEILGEIAKVERRMGNRDAAIERYQEAIAGFKKISDADPTDRSAFDGMVTLKGNLANALAEARQLAAGAEQLDEMIKLLEEYLATRSDTGMQRLLTNAYSSRVVFYFMEQQPRKALPLAQKSAKLAEELLQRDPYLIESRELLGQCCANLETNYRMLREFQAANDTASRAITMYKSLLNEFPENRSYKLRLVALLVNRAVDQQNEATAAEIEKELRQSIEIMGSLLAETPEDLTPLNSLNVARGALAGLLSRTNRLDEALEVWQAVDRTESGGPFAALHQAQFALSLAKATKMEQAIKELAVLKPLQSQSEAVRWVAAQTLVLCASIAGNEATDANRAKLSSWLSTATECILAIPPARFGDTEEMIEAIKNSSEFEILRNDENYARLQAAFPELSAE